MYFIRRLEAYVSAREFINPIRVKCGQHLISSKTPSDVICGGGGAGGQGKPDVGVVSQNERAARRAARTVRRRAAQCLNLVAVLEPDCGEVWAVVAKRSKPCVDRRRCGRCARHVVVRFVGAVPKSDCRRRGTFIRDRGAA